MASQKSAPDEVARIRGTIGEFLQNRLQSKLDKLDKSAKRDDDEDRQRFEETRRRLVAEHRPAVWIADAARRVAQIQQVSHAIKFTHPSADGSSLFSAGNRTAGPLEVGSHTLTELPPDVVGNAAALDVYGFLRLAIDGRTLLDRAVARDPALAKALSDDDAQASRWMASFAALPEPRGLPTSHTLAKQMYWPTGDGTYHLLAPLFASSLANVVHKRLADDRFSDVAKEAREARRASVDHGNGYRDYPHLAIQSFGGSKPQNISQLNSERRGENYLLASMPPVWKSATIRLPLNTETVFTADRYFADRPEVRRITKALREFLRRVADAGNNVRIRNMRRQLVADLCDQALLFAGELREQEPGWSARADCHLNLAEQCWLDSARALTDEDFAIQYRRGTWKDDVCLRFGNWLNARLQTDRASFGAAEAFEWRGMLEQELEMLREGFADE